MQYHDCACEDCVWRSAVDRPSTEIYHFWQKAPLIEYCFRWHSLYGSLQSGDEDVRHLTKSIIKRKNNRYIINNRSFLLWRPSFFVGAEPANAAWCCACPKIEERSFSILGGFQAACFFFFLRNLERRDVFCGALGGCQHYKDLQRCYYKSSLEKGAESDFNFFIAVFPL